MGGAGVNYYERHLGDYARDAGHLTMLEHGAYTLLLDRCYTTEGGIPADQAHRICRARTREERAAVDTVLAEFFTLADGCWVNGRASREVTKMQAKVKAAQENGKRGGRPRRTEPEPDGNPPGSESVTQIKAHQSPDTSNTPIAPKGAPKAAAVGLKAWIEAIKARGEKPIPAGDPVLAYADRVGLPREFLVLAWQQFLHTYTTSRDGKRYRDWRKVFRNAVEANWLRLWYLDGQAGGYALTTVGHQAQRAHDDRRAA